MPGDVRGTGFCVTSVLVLVPVLVPVLVLVPVPRTRHR
jgi:hypothetical protein